MTQRQLSTTLGTKEIKRIYIYSEGYRAYLAGYTLDDGPYRGDFDDYCRHITWCEGWIDAYKLNRKIPDMNNNSYYEEGHRAYYANYEIDDSPYGEDLDDYIKHLEWCRGWMDADRVDGSSTWRISSIE